MAERSVVCAEASDLGAVLRSQPWGRPSRKEGNPRADVERLLTRLTPLIPMQIPRKGEAEKVVLKAFILNCESLKNQKK